MCLLISRRRSVVAPEQFGICSNPISLDNLPGINQGREVEADHIHLQLRAIAALNHGANDSILDFSVVQVHADFVTDLELRVVRLLADCHAKECTPEEGYFSSSESAMEISRRRVARKLLCGLEEC